MSKAKFHLMEKTVNLDQIEGKYSAFAKVPYALAVRMSKPIARDGYGTVTVNGEPVPQGTPYFMDSVVKMHCMLVPVGSVAREYDTEYTAVFSGFTAEDGTPFQDRSFRFHTLPRGKQDAVYCDHDELAVQAAREGMVLLKNDGHVLPFAPDSILNCFGAAQFMFRNTSTGASLINPRWQANFHQAVTEHSGFVINREISGLYLRLEDVTPTKEQLTAASVVSDTALIFISRTSGEFLDNRADKGGYYLTDDERAMLEAVCRSFPKTVAILNTGHPIEMGWVNELGVSAVLYTGFAGQGAGYALVELLDGRTNPSGKLPDTWTLDYYDNPASRNFINFKAGDKLPGEKDCGVLLYYEEDIYMGYRYFDTFQRPVAYGFGHGLSYTDFAIEVEHTDFDGQILTARVKVTNKGDFAGKEVVQLYIHAPEEKLEKPNRVLVSFEKTRLLERGESQTLELTADAIVFSSFNEETGSYILEPGVYSLFCGASLEGSVQAGCFELTRGEALRSVKPVCPPVEEFHRMTQRAPYVHEDSRMVPMDKRIPIPAARPVYAPEPLPAYRGKKITFEQVKKNPSLLDAFVAQMDDAELCRLNVSAGANWYMPWQDGSAGSTYALKKYGMPSVKVSDGNTGLNIKKPNIGFPSSTVMAATFNKELAYQVGKALGEEARENGIAVNLGPGMNLHRSILNGRHPEYFSEDPLLAGTMAGYHGKGLVATGIGCTYKHLVCNNSDTSRKGSHSIVSERALRELYFRVFECAIAVQMPTCIMTSYNAVNGLYPAENANILQKLVRGEWGFDGPIMTDWCSYDTIDPVEIVKAGNGWLTEGGMKYVKILRSAVKGGKLSRSVLEQNARSWIILILRSA